MDLEKDFLSGLTEKMEAARLANMRFQTEKKRILDLTVDTKEYCTAVGISRNTLSKRRDNGEVKFAIIGSEYRYFLPEIGVLHD